MGRNKRKQEKRSKKSEPINVRITMSMGEPELSSLTREDMVTPEKVICSSCSENVYVKESKIHGRGAFAKRDIKKGELITNYPVDIIVERDLGRATPSKRCVELYGRKMDLDGDQRHLRNYIIGINDNIFIMGCPEFDNDPTFMGQFINDSHSHDSTEESIKKYEASFDGHNCMILPSALPSVIARKDIKKDEELLTSYGWEYWIIYNKNH